MTFSLHQGGVVMSSQIKHTHSIIEITILFLKLCSNGTMSARTGSALG